MGNSYKIFVEQSKEKNNLRDLDVDGLKILNWIFEK